MARNSMSYFYSSIAIATFGVGLGFYLGGWHTAWVVAVLAVLEISLSFDNAVVNASVLKNWNHKWRQIFIWIGLPVAVFGMRAVFPILIVSLTTGLGMGETLTLAIDHPDEYSNALMAVHHEVAAFGGAFLMMVALQFFMDSSKDVHWWERIEGRLTRVGEIQAVEAALTIGAVIFAASYLGEAEQMEFIMAGLYGVLTYIGTKALGTILGDSSDGGSHIVKQGIGGFLYLEVLDASFSFDGVIGAFALSNNLLVIMIGLGIGAMFVRSLTIYLVNQGTLGEYRYLEHGAFYAIAALAVIMLAGVRVEIPETVTGLVGAILIGIAVWSSIRHRRKEEASAAAGVVASSET